MFQIVVSLVHLLRCIPQWCVAGECVRQAEEAPEIMAATSQNTTELSNTSAGTTQTTPNTATTQTTANTATTQATANTATTQTTATTPTTYSTPTPPTTTTALVTPTTHKYKQVTLEEPTPAQKHTRQSHLRSTTPSTDDLFESPTVTTTQAGHCCRPLKASFRQCLNYSARKDFVHYWKCLV